MEQQHGLSGATFVVRQHDATLTESQGRSWRRLLGAALRSAGQFRPAEVSAAPGCAAAAACERASLAASRARSATRRSSAASLLLPCAALLSAPRSASLADSSRASALRLRSEDSRCVIGVAGAPGGIRKSLPRPEPGNHRPPDAVERRCAERATSYPGLPRLAIIDLASCGLVFSPGRLSILLGVAAGKRGINALDLGP